MAKDTNGPATETLGFGDLGVIRNILLGDQVARIDSKLIEHEDGLSQIKQMLDAQDKSMRAFIAEMEVKITKRLDQIELNVQQAGKHQSDALKTTIESERKQLSALLRNVSEQLVK